MKSKELFVVVFFMACVIGCFEPKIKQPIGNEDVYVAVREEYGLETNTTIWGLIVDENGVPLDGIVVTDGFSVTTTDSRGIYQLVGHSRARFIQYYTTPSEYAIHVDDENHPSFYAKINKGTSLFRQDFELMTATKEENWTLICVGDPQTSTYENVERFINESLVDIDRTIHELKSRGEKTYLITLGDIVHDKPDLYPAMKAAMGNREAPFFQVLGNHDHTLNANDAVAHEVFEDYFGPRNYSFDRGDAHIVAIDNYINLNNLENKPTGGLTDDIWEWLKADLALVPKEKLVILCAHVPFKQGTASTHGRDVVNLLKTFKEAHIMSAHTHTNYKWKHDSSPTGQLMEHIHGTICGAHWRSKVCLDGTPNGYGVYHIRGNHISDYYKATGEEYDRNYQLRIYDGAYHFYAPASGYYFNRVFGEAVNRVVANVWNGDETWRITLEEEGYAPVVMNQTLEPITDWCAYSYHLHFKDKLWTGETNHFWHVLLPSGKEPEAATFTIIAEDIRNNVIYTASSSPSNPNIQFDYNEVAYP